jgi:PAS domain S-box-containing protein
MDKLNKKQQQLDPVKQAFRISLIYFVTGALWIIISDLINVYYHQDSTGEMLIEIGKGLLYVTITALLLYYYLGKYFASLHNKNSELIQSEEKYRSLAENMEFSVIRHDRECRYVYLNSAAWKVLKEFFLVKDINEAIGLTPEEVYKDPEVAGIVREQNEHVIQTGEIVKQKLHYKDSYISYSKIPEYNTKGEIVSVMTLISDETETMRNLTRLEETERFNSHLVNSSHVVVYIYDIKNRRKLYANKAIERILGYSGEEIALFGDSFLFEMMHPDDLEKFIGYMTSKVKTLADGEISEFEYRMRHKEGNYLWFKGHDCIYKRDEEGKPEQILGSAIDITALKNTHNLLKQKTEYLNAIVEASPMSIFDLDINGTVLNIWNRASEEIFGWKAEEVIGKILPIVPKDKLNSLQENLEINLSKSSINGKELLRQKKDGSDISIRIYSRPVISENGNVDSIIAYNEDITLQKKYNEEVSRNNEYLRLLYEASLAANNTIDTKELYSKCFGYIEKILNVTGIVLSIVTDDRKYIKFDAIRVNGEDIDASMVPLMQLKPDGKGPQTRTIHTGKPIIISDLENCMKDSKNNFFIDTDGNVCKRDEGVENVSRASIMIPLKHENTVIGVLHVQSYKTDLYTEEDLHKLEPFAFIFASAMERAKLYQKLQNELAEKEIAFEQVRKFAKGIENSPNSIIITNANYEIEFINPYFTELTGYTLEEVQGKNPSILQSGQTKKEVYEDLWKTLENRQTWYGEFLNLKKNGELYWEAASIGPIMDSWGKVTHYIAIKQDITEKKKKDKEIKDSLLEKEIMLKEIHHRVKNNLQVISSLLDRKAY